MGKIYSQDYVINYFDSDIFLKAKITSILKFFENNAVMQSESLNVGLDYYREKGVIWVLHKWDVKINRMPDFKETVTVTTQPYSFNGFYAYRYYEIFNSSGDKIITAKTEWLFIDTSKRRPIKINEEMYNKYGLTGDENKPLQIRNINPPQNVDEEKTFTVRRSDIDTNRHVNNIQYVAWAMEAVPENIIENFELSDLIVVYKKETDIKSVVKSQVEVKEEKNSLRCIHLIADEEKEVSLIETRWKKK